MRAVILIGAGSVQIPLTPFLKGVRGIFLRTLVRKTHAIFTIVNFLFQKPSYAKLSLPIRGDRLIHPACV